jgi:hypothetical protein
MLGACLALLAGAPFGLRACKAGNVGAELDAALADWFAVDAVETVGRRVLSLGEGWNAAAPLRESLLIHLTGAEDSAGARRKLADAIRDDFRQQRIVAVEGWWLAETEARLYALAVLRAAAGA